MASRRFSHWLIRTVGYEAMLVADRRILHRRAAEAVENLLFGDDGTPADAESLQLRSLC